MLTYYIITNKGERANNEDCADGIIQGECGCFVLADGLGGHGKGEVASQAVCMNALAIYNEKKGNHDALEWIFRDSQERLMQLQKDEKAINEMKTTMVVLLINEDTIRWGHVGDSRLYYFKKILFKKKLVSHTFDHSVPQALVDSGEIKQKEIRHHSDRNRLLRVMGMEWDKPMYTLSDRIKSKKNQAFLMCSDGLWENVEESEMEKFLNKANNVEEWVKMIAEKAFETGKGNNMDNYTAMGIWLE